MGNKRSRSTLPFTLEELDDAADEQLAEWAKQVAQGTSRVPRRRKALVALLRRIATEAEEPQVDDADEGVEEEDFSRFSLADLRELAKKYDIKGRSRKDLGNALQAAGVDIDGEINGAANPPSAARDKKSTGRAKVPEKDLQVVEEKAEVDDQPWTQFSLAALREVAKKHDVKSGGRSRESHWKALSAAGINVAQEAGGAEEEEDDVNDDERNDPMEEEEEVAEYSMADLRSIAKMKKIRVPGRQSKAALEAALKAAGVNLEEEVQKLDNLPDNLPFDACDLLSATAVELKKWGKEVGATSKTKADLLRELREMLPPDDRWESSEDNWESIRIPGLNGYGNVDVRDGVADGWVHFRGLRLAPTCRANHIPCAPAMVGFRSYRGQYSAETDGVVIREKDVIKLRAALKSKDNKRQRAEERKEVRMNTPREPEPWTFLDLPQEEAAANCPDYSLLGNGVWITIARFMDSMDVMVLGRVSRSFRALSHSHQLWLAKLHDDFLLCDKHRAEADPRAVYEELGSAGGCEHGCCARRPGITFESIYCSRAETWLKRSTLTTRKEALSAACKKLGVIPHHSSKLVPAFHQGTAGSNKGPMEVAAILKGVSWLFATGGHPAFSQYHEDLHSDLRRIKFSKRLTWLEALEEWEAQHEDSVENCNHYGRGGYSSDDVECWNCGGYGHRSFECYY